MARQAWGLPQPLPPSEAALIRRVFSLQDAGSVAEAARETQKLPDNLLLGAILADRYLHGSYRAPPAELSAWLARFGDQPEAPAIREVLERLAPDATEPALGAEPAHAAHGRRPAGAAEVRSLFVENRDEAAIAAATPLLRATPASPDGAEALFVAGLAAWRLAQSDIAIGFFDAAYHAASSAPLRAASAFWAGRVKQHISDRGGICDLDAPRGVGG